MSGGGKIRIITTSGSSSYSDLEGYEETFQSQDNIPYCDRNWNAVVLCICKQTQEVGICISL